MRLFLAIWLLTSCIEFGSGERDNGDSDTDEENGKFGFGTYEMITAITNRDPFEFNGYGNYCGIGGSGDIVDNLDRCCHSHDVCYDKAISNECVSFKKRYNYLLRLSYKFAVEDRTPKCIYGEFAPFTRYIMLEDSDAYKCGYALCQCDVTAAKCFAREEYNPKNRKHYIHAG